MLVLTRKRDQWICIGDGVEIVVKAVSGDRVQLGIAAPREVPIRRARADGAACCSPAPSDRADRDEC